MLDTLLKGLRSITSNDVSKTRRHDPRRANDKCVAVVNARTFPVENWSFGGTLLVADSRMFGIGAHIDMVLKFKLANTIIDVPQHGTIVRKANDRIAVKFDQSTQAIRRALQQVIDDSVASEFATSQV